jgi:hypothetical protein
MLAWREQKKKVFLETTTEKNPKMDDLFNSYVLPDESRLDLR